MSRLGLIVIATMLASQAAMAQAGPTRTTTVIRSGNTTTYQTISPSSNTKTTTTITHSGNNTTIR